MSGSTIVAHDTFVRPQSPFGMAIGTLLTAGVLGAVVHHRVNSELQRYGRARGRMPFPFVVVSPGASTTGWVFGLFAWCAVIATIVTYAQSLADGHEPGAGDITMFASLALLLAPLLLVSFATLRRIRTAQHMAGVESPLQDPLRRALLATAMPPIGAWIMQHELNRVWQAYA